MTDVSIGKYYGPITNFDVEATGALKGKQKASDALNTAKANSGAEVTVIDAAGNATVHGLKPEKGIINKPKPTASGLLVVDNLSSGLKPDKTKPLAIDPSIAGKLGGEVALFVDEKNQTKVINGDKNTVASKYLDNPNASKVDAAYTIAGDDNFVNKKMASNVISDLNANYRNTDATSKEVGLMKDGQVKTGMNALIGELKNISANTSQLETQSRQRTEKFNGDIAKPQDRLNKANNAWDTANRAEDQKIGKASEDLREARFPGVHDTENDISTAKQMVNDGKGYLQNANKRVSDAQGEVNRLENLKTKTNQIVEQNKDLDASNKRIVYDMANYFVNRKDQLVNLKSSFNERASYYEGLASAESRKPAAPQGTVGMTRADADKLAQKISGGDGWISKEDLTNNGLSYLAENGAARDKVAGSDNKISTQEFSDAVLLGRVNLPNNAPSTPSGGNSTSSDPFGGKPTNGGGNSTSGDPFANKPTNGGGNSTSGDPFANKPTNGGGGNSTSGDPFANKPTNGGGNSTSSDPFSNSNGQYKNDNAVQDFKRIASSIRADANSIDMRIQSINQVINEARAGGPDSRNFRFAVEKLSDSGNYNGYGYVLNEKDNGYNFFKDDINDRGIIKNNFLKPYDSNNAAIRDNNQQIDRNVSEYKNNINGANQKLNDAKVSESQASGNLQGAQSRLTQLNAQLDSINSKAPVADSVPSVKTAKGAYESAVKHKDATVGDGAALTKEKTAAQGVVDSLTESHSSDIKDLNSKIAGNAAQAQQKINETKRNLGL